MQKHQVKALLMGGQACVWYGAAEFSRDTDLLVLIEDENLERLNRALDELRAECIAVPPFESHYLERGHAIHFRCHHPDAEGLRVDIMSRMRGVAPFSELWVRRETLQDEAGNTYELLSLPDLVRAKKTQREKDWPMVRRLVEAHYIQHRATPNPARIEFWFRELRTPEFLVSHAAAFPDDCRQIMESRPLLQGALVGDMERLARELNAESAEESVADREYWRPLKRELEQLRRNRRAG
jgi:hypothetical protein